jgi:hypothetical protein
MNTERFKTELDGFDLLGLRAEFRFRTETSVGFALGWCPIEGRGLNLAGHLQVHYPCGGHVNLMIFVSLSEQHREFRALTKRDTDKLRTIPERVMAELMIAPDEIYELHVRYYGVGDLGVYVSNRTDTLESV